MHSLCRRLYIIYSGRGITKTLTPLNISKHVWVKNSACFKNFCTHENSHENVLKEVSNGDEEVEYKLKVLVMEMELLRQEGELVPPNDQMKAKYFKELLKLRHRNQRRKYLEYLFKLCKTKENELKKKKEKALKYEEYKKTIVEKELSFEEFVQAYDLSHNSIFVRIRDKTINNLYNSRLINAMQFGQKLIFDCGFHDKMTDRENRNCAKQLMLLFGDNRIHDDPYDLHFCNFDKSSSLATHLHTLVPTMYDPEFPMNIHENSYLDLFPKDKLVYLTPHCREEMKEYDHDAFYIVGGIVDKVNQAPLSLAKAKEENVRMMKFPLDRYLSWTGGSGKSLTLNQVVLILLDMKKTGDWKYALRHVPQRKLVKDEDILTEVKEKLLKTKKRWSDRIDLNNLSYRHKNNGFRRREVEPERRQVSVSSLFRNNKEF